MAEPLGYVWLCASLQPFALDLLYLPLQKELPARIKVPADWNPHLAAPASWNPRPWVLRGLLIASGAPRSSHWLVVDARYAEPITVDDLAAAAGLSRAHFTRMFTRTFGETPRGPRGSYRSGFLFSPLHLSRFFWPYRI